MALQDAEKTIAAGIGVGEAQVFDNSWTKSFGENIGQGIKSRREQGEKDQLEADKKFSLGLMKTEGGIFEGHRDIYGQRIKEFRDWYTVEAAKPENKNNPQFNNMVEEKKSEVIGSAFDSKAIKEKIWNIQQDMLKNPENYDETAVAKMQELVNPNTYKGLGLMDSVIETEKRLLDIQKKPKLYDFQSGLDKKLKLTEGDSTMVTQIVDGKPMQVSSGNKPIDEEKSKAAIRQDLQNANNLDVIEYNKDLMKRGIPPDQLLEFGVEEQYKILANRRSSKVTNKIAPNTSGEGLNISFGSGGSVQSDDLIFIPVKEEVVASPENPNNTTNLAQNRWVVGIEKGKDSAVASAEFTNPKKEVISNADPVLIWKNKGTGKSYLTIVSKDRRGRRKEEDVHLDRKDNGSAKNRTYLMSRLGIDDDGLDRYLSTIGTDKIFSVESKKATPQGKTTKDAIDNSQKKESTKTLEVVPVYDPKKGKNQ